MNIDNLLTEEPKKVFFHYLGNTVFGNITHALYILVDVFAIGVGVGSIGLAAMNITLPIFTLFTAVSLCIGVGGSATMSFLNGAGRSDEAQKIFSMCSYILIGFGIIFGIIATIFVEPLAYMLGSNAETIGSVKLYLVPVLLSCFGYMYSHMLSAFLRNDGNPRLAMGAMIISSLLNIVGDIVCIFVLKMGIIGASLPTAIAPIISILIMCKHFYTKDCTLHFEKQWWNKGLLRRILINGCGAFVLEITSGISILILNTVLLRDYGLYSVSLYTIMANISYLGKYLFNGVGQAAQPIISVNEGANKRERSFRLVTIATVTAFLFGFLFFIVIYLFPRFSISLFTSDSDLIAYGIPYIGKYFICMLFAGINTVLMYYFQSANHPFLASAIAVCKSFIFFLIGMVILPPFFGLMGIYMSTAFSEAITCIIFGIAYLRIWVKFKKAL